MLIDFIKSLYYELLSHFVVEKNEYIITGKCNKCGKCCHEIRAKGLKNEKELKFMRFIFPMYRNFYISSEDEAGNLILTCKHVKENGQCAIYPKRPLFCRRYPAKKVNSFPELIEGCSYKVIKKEFKDYL